MLALLLATLAHAADEPPVWDWSKPHRYRLTSNERMNPPIKVGIADNTMTEIDDYLVTLEVTCGASATSAGAGGTTVLCKVDDVTLKGRAERPADQVQLDATLRELETWLHGATVDFVQRSNGTMKRVGEVEPGRDAKRMSAYRTDWLNVALNGCLMALDVAVSPEETEWRTPIPAGSMKVHVTERTAEVLTFEGEHGDVAQISVKFDLKPGVIETSRVYHAALGNTATDYWSRESVSDLLDAPKVTPAP